MLASWLPWKFILKRIARSYGFLDPVTFMARLRRLSQPSEVQEPLELIRAGVVFHARGLINTKVIQNNLDWVWPYWVEKQFNPNDPSFLPRAYSLTHVNLTQRNWTAVGRPDLPVYPLVDPRGLVTPFHDGWSLDFWILTDQGEMLLPSKLPHVHQVLEPEQGLAVKTLCRKQGMDLTTRVLVKHDTSPELVMEVKGRSACKGWLAISLRPYNPEGIQFMEKIAFDAGSKTWVVDYGTHIRLSEAPDRILFSNYYDGDVIHKLMAPQSESSGTCPVGLATSAALFPLENHTPKAVDIRISLKQEVPREFLKRGSSGADWESVISKTARLQVPDSRFQYLYEAAKRTLVLLSATGPFPGPNTYRRFWFRDACLMINALLSLGLTDRCSRLLNAFPSRQKYSGYFESQEGEWDSNGQVLWILDRFQRLSGLPLNDHWVRSIIKGADWIRRKRTPRDAGRHGGLLPAGFSAEHLGPNDFYYWDDFWGLAGLRSAARLCGLFHPEKEGTFQAEAEDFEKSIFDTIEKNTRPETRGAIPASPYRRMDSGAIGSLVADYPLQITSENDERVTNTADFLMRHCLHEKGFFQDMIHSGINVYLTLGLAQTLLRRGDLRYRYLIQKAAELASSTGQWPEAVHPITGGGCMGDGQHGWAAAEWVQMIRNLFIREEKAEIILGSGLYPEWLRSPEDLFFGPTPTPYGDVSVRISKKKHGLVLHGEAQWRTAAPRMEIRIPGYRDKVWHSVDQPCEIEPAADAS
ncbi:MAG: hypothetical protein K9N21_06625 [Deltaproteobacteria bacterium]|nr:hypothetical protein [Deltaproteobacteria bacterium]